MKVLKKLKQFFIKIGKKITGIISHKLKDKVIGFFKLTYSFFKKYCAKWVVPLANIILAVVLFNTATASYKDYKKTLSLEKYLKSQEIKEKKRYNSFNEAGFMKLNGFIAEHNLSLYSRKIKFFSLPSRHKMIGYDLIMYGKYLDFLGFLKALDNKKIVHKIKDINLSNSSNGNIKIEVSIDVFYDKKG